MNELLLELVQSIRRAQLKCEEEYRESGLLYKDTYFDLTEAVDALVDEIAKERL